MVSTKKLDARVSQDEIPGIYAKIAGIYDIWGNFTESRARDRAIELADIKDGSNILEVAVGTGLAFYEIVRRNQKGENIGIDLTVEMLQKAENRLKELNPESYSLEVGSAFQLEIEDESIDILMNNYMFDLIPYDDMERIIVEFKRVLKRSGKLVLVNMTKGERMVNNIFDFIYRMSPRLMGGCRGVRMSERLQEHGFRIEKREYYQQMLFPSEVILAYK